MGERLGVTGAAIGHYEAGIWKPSPDRAVQLTKLLGMQSGDVAASERGSAGKIVARSRSMHVTRGASRVRDAVVRRQDEALVLVALRAMPAAKHRVVVKLILAYGSTGLRAAVSRQD
ncbi:helix-turn-helix domain-containing protein [Dankookia sp. P2]|uniref:helix-turn-helix domain-containing protein n=1 Tax=Dankookia sp. P2 TaxID=3423955 RepID=UPI003D6797DE